MSIDSVRPSSGLNYATKVDTPKSTAGDHPQIQAATDLPSAPVRIDLEANKRNVKAAIAEANARLQQAGQALQFNYDEAADYTVVTVQNATTGEVVRQIPNEAVLRVAHNIERVKGFLLDKAA